MVGEAFIKAVVMIIVATCSDSGPSYINEIREGDLIFQTSTSAQSKAIQAATRSKYSHCGIIYKEGNNYYVYEAVQPVKCAKDHDYLSDKGLLLVLLLRFVLPFN